jgi:L-serine/L-threonine ammonia-lyase
VELACSTTLTPAYKPDFFSRLVPSAPAGKEQVVVFIVCGGFKISMSEMNEYHDLVEADIQGGERQWEVFCDGERWHVDK